MSPRWVGPIDPFRGSEGPVPSAILRASSPPPSPANDLGEMYIEGQCSTKSQRHRHAARSVHLGSRPIRSGRRRTATRFRPTSWTSSPSSPAARPTPISATLAPFEAARSSMGEAYRTADLGPLSPCTTGSLPTSVFPRGFDTASGADLDLNNSATPAGTAAIDLTPDVSYSCRSRAGELSWTTARSS